MREHGFRVRHVLRPPVAIGSDRKGETAGAGPSSQNGQRADSETEATRPRRKALPAPVLRFPEERKRFKAVAGVGGHVYSLAIRGGVPALGSKEEHIRKDHAIQTDTTSQFLLRAGHRPRPDFVSGIDEGTPGVSPGKAPSLTPELLERVRNRDEQALNVFFNTFFDRAYGYVCRLVRDVHEAEDITQVAFMKMHRAIHTLDPGRDPTSWVFAVVSNTVRDHWRSRRYKQSLKDKPLENAPLTDHLTAEDDQAARDTAKILERALEELSDNLRAVILLRDYEDLSYADVAGVLGIEEAAARKRHSRALNELRKALQDERLSVDKMKP